MTIAFLHQLIWICFTRVALARFFASLDSVPPVEHNAPANPLFKRSIQVRLPYGTFYGSENKQVRYFLGIPYAQPPVGKMRFERPRPPIRKLGLQDATRFGAGCFQDPIAPPLNGIRLNKSESCLNANVWAPSGHSSNDDPIPVLVWVLPGGFTSGYSSNPLYDGSAVIKNSKEKVMVVSFDYRMGIFGNLLTHFHSG
jgi:carboxylesterase type B